MLQRIFEWWEINKAEILAATSGFGAVISATFIWFKSKKPFLSLISSAKTTDERENALIKGYNEVVEVVKEYNSNIEKLTGEIVKLQTVVLDTEDIEAHIAKVLSTVYTNSIALPQGVKDIINVECAQAMSIANRDLGVEVTRHDEQDEGESA